MQISFVTPSFSITLDQNFRGQEPFRGGKVASDGANPVPVVVEPDLTPLKWSCDHGNKHLPLTPQANNEYNLQIKCLQPQLTYNQHEEQDLQRKIYQLVIMTNHISLCHKFSYIRQIKTYFLCKC